MDPKKTNEEHTETFIQRWHQAAGSELATAQSFVIELCELLGVERPHATADQDYMFERPLKEGHSDGSESDRRVDCYKRGHFILEAKKVNTGSYTKSYSHTLMDAHAHTSPRSELHQSESHFCTKLHLESLTPFRKPSGSTLFCTSQDLQTLQKQEKGQQLKKSIFGTFEKHAQRLFRLGKNPTSKEQCERMFGVRLGLTSLFIRTQGLGDCIRQGL
jgi:hypothetical protein